MYLASIKILERSGFEHYEVSNFALPGFQCRHNNVYWNADEYFAFGPGQLATSTVFADQPSQCREVDERTGRRRPVWKIVKSCPTRGCAREAIMLALRRMQGLHLPSFESRFHLSLHALAPDEFRGNIWTMACWFWRATF